LYQQDLVEMGSEKRKQARYAERNKSKAAKRAMKSHESDERKHIMVKNLKMKQLKDHVIKQEERMRKYIPDRVRAIQNAPIDPQYDLKGAARIAREHYRPPGYDEEVMNQQPIDLMELYCHDIWAAPDGEGKKLIEAKILYASGLHNVLEKSSDSINAFKEILALDPKDHYQCNQKMLRIHLDNGDADLARALLDENTQDMSCCFLYNRALVEYISHYLLQEEGSSKEVCETALRTAYLANPYAIFTLAYHSTFTDIVEYVAIINNPVNGSIEDAFSFFDSDIELWVDVEGAINWVREFYEEYSISVPSIDRIYIEEKDTDAVIEEYNRSHIDDNDDKKENIDEKETSTEGVVSDTKGIMFTWEDGQMKIIGNTNNSHEKEHRSVNSIDSSVVEKEVLGDIDSTDHATDGDKDGNQEQGEEAEGEGDEEEEGEEEEAVPTLVDIEEDLQDIDDNEHLDIEEKMDKKIELMSTLPESQKHAIFCDMFRAALQVLKLIE
jgi:tetratricopeptide (TPR) repeat protein